MVVDHPQWRLGGERIHITGQGSRSIPSSFNRPPLFSSIRDTPAIFDPVCELLALLPNIHKPWPGLKHLERIPNIVLIHLALIILLGLVLGTRPLRPIEWRVWAGKIEREGEEGFVDNEGEVNKDYIGNPFQVFEARPGFVDIRKC